MQFPIPNGVFLFVLFCLLISPAYGHDCWGGHHCEDGWNCDHHGSRYAVPSQGSVSPSYASPAPKVINGKVSEIIYLPGTTADSAMVEVRVTAGAGATLVQLAPVGLLKQSQLTLREGDVVSITGFDVNGMDGDLLVATEIHKGEKHLILRDTRGRPTW
jgi:hypothetical protein